MDFLQRDCPPGDLEGIAILIFPAGCILPQSKKNPAPLPNNKDTGLFYNTIQKIKIYLNRATGTDTVSDKHGPELYLPIFLPYLPDVL